MALKNQSLVVQYTAWDTSANAGKTGDAANHTLRVITDGTAAAPTNAPAEVDATNVPGVYKITLTAAEMNGNSVTLAGKSSTAGVVVIPVHVTTERGVLPAVAPGSNGGLPLQGGAIPNANAAAAGGLPTVDANNRIAGVQGTKNTLDALNDVSATTVRTQVDNALVAVDLDHLIEVSAGAEKPTVGSYADKLMNKNASQTFDPTTDSLEAIRDNPPATSGQPGME